VNLVKARYLLNKGCCWNFSWATFSFHMQQKMPDVFSPDSPLPPISKTLMAWVSHIMPLSQLRYNL